MRSSDGKHRLDRAVQVTVKLLPSSGQHPVDVHHVRPAEPAVPVALSDCFEGLGRAGAATIAESHDGRRLRGHVRGGLRDCESPQRGMEHGKFGGNAGVRRYDCGGDGEQRCTWTGRQLAVREWAVRGTSPSAHVEHASDLLCAAMVMDSVIGG